MFIHYLHNDHFQCLHNIHHVETLDILTNLFDGILIVSRFSIIQVARNILTCRYFVSLKLFSERNISSHGWKKGSGEMKLFFCFGGAGGRCSVLSIHLVGWSFSAFSVPLEYPSLVSTYASAFTSSYSLSHCLSLAQICPLDSSRAKGLIWMTHLFSPGSFLRICPLRDGDGRE